MKRGTVPFNYLGVIVSPKRLSILDCQCLVERVVDRIRGLGSKKLSYARRIVLIKAVLSTPHCYWAKIFILPKTMISKIEAICRKYLWHGTDHKESPSLVSWDQICKPRKQGGLGVKDFHVWNLATVRNMEHYSITLGYQWLNPDGDVVPWYPWMLNEWIIPKQQFICWLISHQRLLTQDRLLRMGVIQNNKCFLCGLREESLDHLFFACPFNSQCSSLVGDWCRIQMSQLNCIRWWAELRQIAAYKKKVIPLVLAGLMYHVWLCRNRCRIDGYVIRPKVILANVKNNV
ncbi:uncharacterized protein LOC141590236 [Silene latifolia]|uniref:uncharacterized protein LOC141590236 n=1 Tax=Silene latifolia TaxID=37657 RepID=UPI003D76F4E1